MNILDKLKDWFLNLFENLSKREDKDVLKKIPFWLVFFFPYGFYLFFFKTKVKKTIKIVVGIILSVFLVVFIDIAKYPNRIYNEVAKTSFIEFREDNPSLNLDELSYLDKTSHFKIDDDMYFVYSIYTKWDMYNGVFKVIDYNKEFELMSLYEVDYEFENIYAKNEFDKLTDIHPLALSYIFSNFNNARVDNIISITDVVEGDLFLNSIYQAIKVDETEYIFELNDFDVVRVYEILEDKKETLTNDNLLEFIDSLGDDYKIGKGVIYSNTHDNVLVSKLSDNTRGLIVKNFDSSFTVVGYNYAATTHFYSLQVGDKYYCAKYTPGSKSEITHITDMDAFKESLEILLYK